MNKHDMLAENLTILIGVSGGPDSMALLHFFRSIRDDWGLKLIVLSADHQLRGDESRADLDYVKQICKEWDIKFIETNLDVTSYKHGKQIGTQVAARELRYAFFEKQMFENKADILALGHQGDDQVETMLMGIVRSASPMSLSGIPLQRPFATGKIIRPLLCITKDEIEEYCSRYGIIPRRDPSNEQTTYTRNYFRKQLLPLVKEKNSNIHTTIQHLSEALREDEQYLMEEAARMVESLVVFKSKEKEASFDIHAFKTYPRSLQRRAYHLILNYLYYELPKNLSYVHEEQFFTLLKGMNGNVKIDFPSGLKLKRTYRKMTFCFSSEQTQNFCYYKTVEVAGEIKLPNGITVTAEYTDTPNMHSEANYICKKDSVVLPLHIRTRQIGDRMSWKGLEGSKKVKDIFIDAKIPLNQRDNWPILTDNNGEILWVIGLKKGQPQKQVESGTYIQLCYEKGNV